MKYSFFLVLLIAVACGKPLPVLDSIDLDAWKRDRQACQGLRTRDIEVLKSQRAKLTSLTEMDIVKLLGKPDQTELYKRNQKFYYYFLEPSAECPGGSSTAQRLTVRFNAVGLAKEIVFE
ncbi:MAG: hypothetical protein MUC38_00255 [Cyclobacteriaceae bacterium]|jgi:hypothetical protein|nr:hypothetical protein [Cyclobacteriaceae bacterium]